jgi:hypothetical protein
MNKYQVIDSVIFKGRVQNVTSFGTFVDVGAGQVCLISEMKLRSARLQLGDRIEGKILPVDINHRHITLDLVDFCDALQFTNIHTNIHTYIFSLNNIIFVKNILEFHSICPKEETKIPNRITDDFTL